MKNKFVKNITAAAILSAILSILLLLSLKIGKILSFIIMLFAILLNWFGIMKQRKGEAVGMPLLRLILSLAIEMYLIFKLEPYMIDLSGEQGQIKMLFHTLSCFIMPLLLNVGTLIGFRIAHNIYEKNA